MPVDAAAKRPQDWPWATPPLDSMRLRPMIAPPHTALLVIDVQEDFVGPRGLLGRAGVDLTPMAQPLDRIEELTTQARAAGVPIVFARVVTRPATDRRAMRLFYERRGESGSEAICRDGTPGADYYRLQPQPGDLQIEKPLFSCFVDTDLEAQLHERGIDTLVVTGFTTECCVDSTVRDAFHRDFNVFIVTDACAAYEATLHRGALDALSRSFALLVDSAAVAASWQGSAAGDA